MSASREKKQRQASGLSEKALQAQQQQASRKKKTIIYTVIGVVVAALVAALLIWNANFDFFLSRTTAATVGGKDVSLAELSYYYYNARMNEFYYYSALGIPVPDDSELWDDETGQTYRDHFLETALDSAQEIAALSDEARKNGHTEAEVKDDLDQQVKNLKSSAASSGYSYSTYLKLLYGSYMSAGVFEKLYTMDLMAGLAYNDKADELLDSYTEADLKAYYEADDHADSLDTFEYSYLCFIPEAVEEKDEDGNARDEDEVKAEKEAALAEAKANAEAAMEAVKDGGSISDQASEYELTDSFYKDRMTSVGVTSAPAPVQDTLLSMKADDIELVENGESGFYVVVLHSRRLVEDPTRDVRHILARAETTTDEKGNAVAPTDEAWAAAKAEIEAIQAEYEAGAKTEDAFAALANEKSDDGDGTTGGLYEKVDVNARYVPEFLDWIFADGRKAGDTGIVQHIAKDTDGNKYWGYHFIYLVGDNDPVWKTSVRNSLTSEALKTWLDALKGNYEAALTDNAGHIGQ